MRRLLLSAGGGGSFAGPTPAPGASGPYDPGFSPGATVLTQLHCHTNQSDGSFTPAAVVADYVAKGYGALALTDHDKVTVQPAGITTPIQANEVSPTAQHIISLNSTYDRISTLTDAQTIIDNIVASGGQAHVAHPNWYRGMTFEELFSLDDYMGVEVHNGKVISGAGQNPITYPAFAVDRWDQLLSAGRRDLWGFAVDDLHGRDAYLTHDVGRVHVFAASNTVGNIMSSLVSGNFVADVSNYGVTPAYPVRDAEGISIDCPGAVRVEAWGQSGLLQAVDADAMTYEYEGSEQYVRLVVWGDYTEGFASLSDRWQPQDSTIWTADGTLHAPGTTGIQQAQLMFHVLNSNYYHVIHIGESASGAYDDKLAIGRATGGTPSGTTTNVPFVASRSVWYRLAMDYTASSGTIRAKVWDRDGGSDPGTWMVSTTNTEWKFGAFGFRAYFNGSARRIILRRHREGDFSARVDIKLGDTGPTEFDNLYVRGFKTYFQPVAID